jgi:hypothetical protein
LGEVFVEGFGVSLSKKSERLVVERKERLSQKAAPGRRRARYQSLRRLREVVREMRSMCILVLKEDRKTIYERRGSDSSGF